jgi:MFS family permease
VAVGAIAGKIGFGFVADLIGQRSMVWIPLALAIVTSVAMTRVTDFGWLAVVSMLLGLAFGAATPAWSLLVAACFGRAGFSLAMGLMTPVVSTLLALCVPFAGWMYDRSGSYDGAWLDAGTGNRHAAGAGRHRYKQVKSTVSR